MEIPHKERVSTMDLSRSSAENVEFMINEIIKKLRMASVGAMNFSHFDLNQYEDIKEIYDVVSEKEKFSINEMEALVSELGKMRKK